MSSAIFSPTTLMTTDTCAAACLLEELSDFTIERGLLPDLGGTALLARPRHLAATPWR